MGRYGVHIRRLCAVGFWLAAWHILSLIISQEILLVSPVAVVVKLVSLSGNSEFWQVIAFSTSRIFLGFFLSAILGIVMAALAARFKLIDVLLEPLVSVIKATPVASFIIIALIWISPRNLSVLISVLIAFPLIYSNVTGGIKETDPQLLEMSKLFGVSENRILRYVYIPQVLPYFRAACSVAFGLCWKSGIAAEIIGMPTGSMGENMYRSKIFLETADLLAWTLVVIFLSVLSEKLFLLLLDKVVAISERG